MNFAEFHAAARNIAKGAYFATSVEVSEGKNGGIKMEWQLYVAGEGNRRGATPEAVLSAALNTGKKQADIDAIGEVPAATVQAEEI